MHVIDLIQTLNIFRNILMTLTPVFKKLLMQYGKVKRFCKEAKYIFTLRVTVKFAVHTIRNWLED